MKHKILKSIIVLAIFSIAGFGFRQLNKDIPKTLTEAGYKNIKIETNNFDSGGNWVSAPNLPIGPRYYSAHCTYTRGDTTWLFVLGGDTTGSGHATRTSFKYNFRTNQWSQISPMPIPLRTHTAAAAGDSIYTFGGLDSPTSNGVDNIFMYSINENTWVQRGNMTTPTFLASATAFGDSLIAIAGGVIQTAVDGGFTESVVMGIWKVRGPQYRTTDPIPEGLAAAQFLALLIDPKNSSYNGSPQAGNNLLKAYLVGGFKTGSVLSADVIECRIDIGDSINTSYIVHPNVIPGGGLARHTGVSLPNGKMIISGGVRTNSFNAVLDHYIFDPDGMTFTMLPSANFPICAHNSGVAIENGQFKFMTTGGITAGQQFTSNSQVYTDSILIGISNISLEVPQNYSLHQNYPNPFNPVTNINFDILTHEENVKLSVFDVTGKEVEILTEGKLRAGSYNYLFSADNLPSGVYFYRLQAGGFSQTRKMVLVK